MARTRHGWYPRRGEVYLVDLDKARPAVILSVDSLNRHAYDVCLVPFTTVQHLKFSMRVLVKRGDGGLDHDCWAKCDQVTTLEKGFLRYPALGVLSDPSFAAIQEQVKIALGLT
jgi:mRNA-degrading endonuclease toxin of MazEF toxin-antitoxin module